MKAFEFVAEVDKQHRLHVVLPESTMPGWVRVIVLVPEDEAGTLWMRGIARSGGCQITEGAQFVRCYKHSASNGT